MYNFYHPEELTIGVVGVDNGVGGADNGVGGVQFLPSGGVTMGLEELTMGF